MNPIDVLIPSFDGFADVWWIADAMFKKYWPDRIWPMYWISNTIPPPAGTLPLMIDPDLGFSGNVLSVIDGLAEAILVWMDECFLFSFIDNEMMLTAARLFYENENIAAVRLGNYHGGPTGPYKDGFGIIHPCTGGRVSTQPIIWRRGVLKYLLENLPASSVFETDSKGLLEHKFPEMLVIAPFKSFKYCEDALRWGKWRRCALDYFREEGLEVDIQKRGIIELLHDGSRGY